MMQVLVSLVSASKMDGDPPQDSTSTEAIPVLPAKLEKHFERHGLTAYHSQSYHITHGCQAEAHTQVPDRSGRCRSS